MEIKIVGSIPDENTLDEIQSIAKIFVYEQRMKRFSCPVKNNTPIITKPVKLQKKICDPQKIVANYLPHVMVKGLI